MRKFNFMVFVYTIFILNFINLDAQFSDAKKSFKLDKISYQTKKSTINSDSLYQFDVVDSFYVICNINRCARLKDIKWGSGFLWILSSSDLLPDSIYQLNPINGDVVNKYRIPIPNSYWSQGFEFDSNSLGGPFFWVSVEAQSVPGSYYDLGIIYKLKVDDFIIDNLYYPPDIFPESIALHNDTMWITGQKNNFLYLFDLYSGDFTPIFPIMDATYIREISYNQNDELVLWMIDHDYFNGVWGDNKKIHKLNPYSGEVKMSYKAPDPWPFGLAWENESQGGPYLWICDYETNKVYKVKEPSVNFINDESQKINFSTIPNPFSNKTKISFNLEEPTYIKITIYNSLGYVLDVLTDEYLSEGTHEFTFDGSAFASGTYYYVLHANGKVETGQLVLIK